jgi:alkylation response protein AidB-like acyl-CoA dehydrogenase
MGGLVEATHSLMESLVLRSTKLSQLDFAPWSALLKYGAAHDLEKVSRESQQVLGGIVYSRGGKGARVEQISRDVRLLVVSGGSEEILMDMIVNQILRSIGKPKM